MAHFNGECNDEWNNGELLDRFEYYFFLKTII
jgi:hypothetical protein